MPLIPSWPFWTLSLTAGAVFGFCSAMIHHPMSNLRNNLLLGRRQLSSVIVAVLLTAGSLEGYLIFAASSRLTQPMILAAIAATVIASWLTGVLMNRKA
ncbi:MAG: hypothetical protein HY336_00910 [Candidatus Doudnabacteria bacterium]|nr:hypothetical protein [Candidatus Doudnabacteria bacterium]